MDGEVDEMDRSSDQWLSQYGPFICTDSWGVPLLHHASQLDAQHADDCVGLSSAGGWMKDRHLMHTQRDQHVESESHLNQHVPRQTVNYRVGSVQEDTAFTVNGSDTACGTTEDGRNPLKPVPNPSWYQEENFPNHQSSPFCPHQQPKVGIGSSSHHQNRNGSSNNFIADPSVATNNEPWSPYNTLDDGSNAHNPKRTQVVVEQNASDATYSMFARNNPDSIYPNHSGLQTPMPNMSFECRPYHFQPKALVCQTSIPTSSRFTSSKSPLRCIHAPVPKFSPRYECQNYSDRVSPLSRTREHRHSYLSPQSCYLAPPMQRRVSSASSQTTEATSSSAISEPTTEVFKCISCNVTFTGRFRKGNKKRHDREKHSNKPPTVCDVCGRKFARSDALQKHSRKQHPRRAADVRFVSRSGGTGFRDEP